MRCGCSLQKKLTDMQVPHKGLYRRRCFGCKCPRIAACVLTQCIQIINGKTLMHSEPCSKTAPCKFQNWSNFMLNLNTTSSRPQLAPAGSGWQGALYTKHPWLTWLCLDLAIPARGRKFGSLDMQLVCLLAGKARNKTTHSQGLCHCEIAVHSEKSPNVCSMRQMPCASPDHKMARGHSKSVPCHFK